jgi:gamma-tubulin complex component 5
LSHFIRQRLGWFVDIIMSYVTETVIRTTTTEMHRRMSEAEDVDAMAAVHQRFIARLQLCCLLSKNLAPIYDSILSILDLAVPYSECQNQHSGKQGENGRTKETTKKSCLQRRGRLGADLSRLYEDSSSEDEDDIDDYDADSETSTARDEPYDERLQKIQDQFSHLLNFTVAGLRGVGRAGGEMSWEMLAERLEWGSNRAGG